MRWAFRVAYWGERFHGSQRQPDVATVEGDLIRVLRRLGAMDGAREARFQSASRTDRGVNALGNVVALDTSWDPRRLIADANTALDDIWLHAYANPGEGFRPRKARERWYRYHYPAPLDPRRLEEGGRLLLGTHDFGGFAKGEGGRCDLRAVEASRTALGTVLDLRADRFLWRMARRIAGSLEAYARGRLTRKALADARDGGVLAAGSCPPGGLVLMDVRYDFPFRSFLVPAQSDLERRAFQRRLESHFLTILHGEGGLPKGAPKL